MLQIRLVNKFPKSKEEAWELAKGPWKLDATRVLEQDEISIIDSQDIVLAIVRLEGIAKSTRNSRYKLIGSLVQNDNRVGKQTSFPHRSRLSIKYV